jgi:hypothetical protein
VCRTCSSSFFCASIIYQFFCGRFSLHVFLLYTTDMFDVSIMFSIFFIYLFFVVGWSVIWPALLDQGSAGAGERTALHDRSIGRREQRRHQSTDVHVCHGHVQLGGHQQPTAEALQRLLPSRCKLSIFQCCQPPGHTHKHNSFQSRSDP